MPPKNDDRLRAIRESAATLRRRPGPEAAPPALEDAAEDQGAITSHFGIAALDTATAGRAIQRLSVRLIAPDLRPESRPPRLLPLPEELMGAGAVAPEHAALLAEIRDLGASLQERQIQP
ncbi:MAG: hypothetical protein HGA45_37250, partial [Chloroflexales bacterium]|nr:hypothetical protein [Chloroflexales bacterium]